MPDSLNMVHILEDKQKTFASMTAAVLGIMVLWFSLPKVFTLVSTYQKRASKMTISVSIPIEERKVIEKDIFDIQGTIRSSDKKGNANYSDQYFTLGTYFERLGYLGKAEGAYRKALREDSKNVPAYTHLGVVLGLMEDYDKSVASFREGIERDPSNTEAYTKLADMYASHMKQREEGRGVYIEGLMRTQNAPDLVRSFIAFLDRTGYTHEADLYRKALRKEKNTKRP